MQPGDPLVTTPAEGFSGWFSRLFKVFGTHLPAMYLIGLATFAIPTALLQLVVPWLTPSVTYTTDADGARVPHVNFDHVGALVGTVLGAAIVIGFLAALGQATFVWTITRRAVGEPAPLGGALRYGLANGVRLWGWTVLYGLMVVAGTVCCLLPGLYLAFAGCLYAAVALYQRGANPIGTSFSMIHKHFGAALGRVVLAALLAFVANFVISTIGSLIARLVSDTDTARGVASSITSLIAIPVNFVPVLIGVLLFAELKAREHPLRSADLAAVL